MAEPGDATVFIPGEVTVFNIDEPFGDALPEDSFGGSGHGRSSLSSSYDINMAISGEIEFVEMPLDSLSGIGGLERSAKDGEGLPPQQANAHWRSGCANASATATAGSSDVTGM